eukprot:TRINITY_DN3520_c0_g1_i2.p1 TRINITY_DN3520_c0_g1~~TRINITY_DN3520_c0_g1_i2.p1  ORF type:complete len:165 (+),score=17.72 TRINITY_DN3520_c0_g1_i2:812-1306(+)
MQSFSPNNTRDFIPLVNHLALYFQIRDDYINLQNDQYMLNKGFCEDLTEGKFSFPIVHAILSNPDDHRLLNILKQRTEDVEIKKYAVSYMKGMGSFDYTEAALKEIEKDIVAEMQQLGGNPLLEAITNELMIGTSKENNNSSSLSVTKPVPVLRLSHEDISDRQ